MNMFDQIFDVTSNEIVEHVKIRRLRRLNNWTTYLICRVPAPKSTKCPVVLENEFPHFAKKNVLRRAGNTFSKKLAYASLDMAVEKKDRSENYNNIVILKSTRERERE